MRRHEDWYAGVYGTVRAAALGPELADARCFQVVSALIDPGFRASLVDRGMSDDDAVHETVRLVVGWLRDNLAATG